MPCDCYTIGYPYLDPTTGQVKYRSTVNFEEGVEPGCEIAGVASLPFAAPFFEQHIYNDFYGVTFQESSAGPPTSAVLLSALTDPGVMICGWKGSTWSSEYGAFPGVSFAWTAGIALDSGGLQVSAARYFLPPSNNPTGSFAIDLTVPGAQLQADPMGNTCPPVGNWDTATDGEIIGFPGEHIIVNILNANGYL